MRSALYIGGVNVRRVSSKRLRDLSRSLGVAEEDATFLALDWEGVPLGVASWRSRADGAASCHLTLADHPESETVLLAIVKTVWRHTSQAAELVVTGAPLPRSRFSPPFSLNATRLPLHWQAFLALPHRYLKSS